jgi:hypothetical protein
MHDSLIKSNRFLQIYLFFLVFNAYYANVIYNPFSTFGVAWEELIALVTNFDLKISSNPIFLDM